MKSSAHHERFAEALGLVIPSPEEGDAALNALTQLVTLTRTQPELARVLEHPSVSVEEKVRLLTGLLPKSSATLKAFLQVVVTRAHIRDLAGVRDAFQRVLDHRRRVSRYRAVTAHPLSEAQKNLLTRKLSDAAGAPVVVEMTQDPRLLGGLKILRDGYEWDASVSGKLKRLREELVRWRPAQTK